ncbi:alpha/beta fold hydrolase [Streptomyces sp. NPDC048717]|uniref:thioesterase II family protein n=1 Tax=Streptomyces sp. NPDC048717 TaxID=3154928 RepID=UPI00341299E2
MTHHIDTPAGPDGSAGPDRPGGSGRPGSFETPLDRWIRRFPPYRTAEHTLVCFPHAGGAASYYHALSTALDPDIELLVIQYPGRENRLFEEPVRSLEAMADAAARALTAHGVERPVFFGHSMGAIVAFETARRLSRTASRPAALVASACAAPSHHEARAERLDGAGEEADTAVLARIMGLGGTRPDVAEHEELIRLCLPALRADFAALERYRVAPEATAPCPITVFAADDDPSLPPADAGRWGLHSAAGPVGVHVFEGDHFYFRERPGPFLELLHRTVREAGRGVAFA